MYSCTGVFINWYINIWEYWYWYQNRGFCVLIELQFAGKKYCTSAYFWSCNFCIFCEVTLQEAIDWMSKKNLTPPCSSDKSEKNHNYYYKSNVSLKIYFLCIRHAIANPDNWFSTIPTPFFCVMRIFLFYRFWSTALAPVTTLP